MIHRSFDSLSCGIVLMNREAEIAFANRKAHALLSTSNIRQIQAAIEKLLREYYLSEPENLEQDEDSVEPGAASNSNIPSLFGPNLSFQLQSRFSRLTSR
jgi:nitrogen-specific signal transduction histidine kinase